MIKNLSTIDVYNTIKAITAISDVTKIYNGIPIDGEEGKTSYIFLTRVSNIPQVSSMSGYLEKKARISFYIVGDEGGYDQENIENIEEIITNELVSESCVKIPEIGGLLINNIEDGGEGVLIYNDKKRQFIVKDYLFTYQCNV